MIQAFAAMLSGLAFAASVAPCHGQEADWFVEPPHALACLHGDDLEYAHRLLWRQNDVEAFKKFAVDQIVRKGCRFIQPDTALVIMERDRDRDQVLVRVKGDPQGWWVARRNLAAPKAQ